jgi:hypothetical protein
VRFEATGNCRICSRSLFKNEPTWQAPFQPSLAGVTKTPVPTVTYKRTGRKWRNREGGTQIA